MSITVLEQKLYTDAFLYSWAYMAAQVSCAPNASTWLSSGTCSYPCGPCPGLGIQHKWLKVGHASICSGIKQWQQRISY